MRLHRKIGGGNSCRKEEKTTQKMKSGFFSEIFENSENVNIFDINFVDIFEISEISEIFSCWSIFLMIFSSTFFFRPKIKRIILRLKHIQSRASNSSWVVRNRILHKRYEAEKTPILLQKMAPALSPQTIPMIKIAKIGATSMDVWGSTEKLVVVNHA